MYPLNCVCADLVKMRLSTDETHQQIYVDKDIPLHNQVLLTTALKLGEMTIRRYTAKRFFTMCFFVN